MGKIAIWILVAIVVMQILRVIASHKRKSDADAGTPGRVGGSRGPGKKDAEDAQPRSGGELMMSCAVCDIHLPASDAVFARGKVFCGPEHRDLDEGSRESR
ncbi:MAG: hypothetical protein H0T52_01220 [Lautropia sp.]|nr:hypothetical protein [Lautropia sp.]